MDSSEHTVLLESGEGGGCGDFEVCFEDIEGEDTVRPGISEIPMLLELLVVVIHDAGAWLAAIAC